MLMNRQSGFLALMFAIIFGALFVGASVFGFWAFGEMNKYKNDTEKIVADAVTVAVDEAETTLENEFVEREKLPTKKYVGPSTYGSVTFDRTILRRETVPVGMFGMAIDVTNILKLIMQIGSH